MNPIHTVAVNNKSSPMDMPDRIQFANVQGIANVVGGGAGLAVTTAVAFTEPLPANYTVLVSPNQDATWFITLKTAMGFSVTLTPRLAANTLAAGTFDLVVFG